MVSSIREEKEVIGRFIKYIDISVDDNYNVKIEI